MLCGMWFCILFYMLCFLLFCVLCVVLGEMVGVV